MFKDFAKAKAEWDFALLEADLVSAKGRHLTPVEKLHLQGLLCGYSPAEIAEKLGKSASGVETDLSASIYRYVKSLLLKPDEKISNWRNIIEWLDEAGYKSSAQNPLKVEDLEIDKTVVQVTNINIDRNQIVFMINLRVPTKYKSDE